MAFIPEDDDNEFFPEDIDDEALPEEASNRTFIIVASVLGGVILLALICIAGFAILRPNQDEAAANAGATEIAQNTQIAEIHTATAEAEMEEQAPLASPSPIASPTASATPVVAVATETPTATPDIAATGTVSAALTQAADAILTVIPTSSGIPSELPDGGFADDVGIPGLVVMMIVFVAVIFFARRLRKSSAV
ncbi:MAG: hypothetical protein GY755_14225 [Chloroflexi bacterium]|nr:hypothetical protein [Chloroflexota bacterium]